MNEDHEDVVVTDGEVIDAPTPQVPDDDGLASSDGDVEDAVDPSPAAATDDRAGYGSCEEALEDAVASLERVTAERDDYLDLARRVQADFENFKRRVTTQHAAQSARAAEQLVVELLPVLDACDAAVAHGVAEVEPIGGQLFGTLGKQGLVRVDVPMVPFDPTVHEAVLSEPADGNADEGPLVVEIMRAGYSWNGKVLRPAMVKVRG